MIESTLNFQSSDLRSIVASVCALPEGLRPTHHSLGENEAGEPILDVETFLDSLHGAGVGPFLKGARVTYDIGYFDGIVGSERVKSQSIVCNCFLRVEPALAKQFLIHMAKEKLIFGFASLPEERERRNRVTTRQGINTIESWVGRDVQKYVPGFYWLTMLSDTLAKQHGISLTAVEAVAQEHLRLEGEQHLFQFYQRPEDWSGTSSVSRLCASLPGVFDIEKVTAQFQTAKNFLELSAMLKNWK